MTGFRSKMETVVVVEIGRCVPGSTAEIAVIDVAAYATVRVRAHVAIYTKRAQSVLSNFIADLTFF